MAKSNPIGDELFTIQVFNILLLFRHTGPKNSGRFLLYKQRCRV